MGDFSDKNLQEMLDFGLTKSEIALKKINSRTGDKKSNVLPKDLDLDRTFNKVEAYVKVLPIQPETSWSLVDSSNHIKGRELSAGMGHFLKRNLKKLVFECEKAAKEISREMRREALPIKVPETDDAIALELPDPKQGNKQMMKLSLPSSPSKMFTMEEAPDFRMPDPEFMFDMQEELTTGTEAMEFAMLNSFLRKSREMSGIDQLRRPVERTDQPSPGPPIRPTEGISDLEKISDLLPQDQVIIPEEAPAPVSSSPVQRLLPVDVQQTAPFDQQQAVPMEGIVEEASFPFKVPEPIVRQAARNPNRDKNVFRKTKLRRNKQDILKLLHGPEQDLLEEAEEVRCRRERDNAWTRWEAPEEFDIEPDLLKLRRLHLEDDEASLDIYRDNLIQRRDLLSIPEPATVPPSELPAAPELLPEQPLPVPHLQPLPEELEPRTAPQIEREGDSALAARHSLGRDLEAPDMMRMPELTDGPQIQLDATVLDMVGPKGSPKEGGQNEVLADASVAPIQDATIIRSVGLRAARDPYKCPSVQPSDSNKSIDLSIQVKREESEKIIRQALLKYQQFTFADIFPESSSAEDKTFGLCGLLHLCQNRAASVSQSSAFSRDIIISLNPSAERTA